MECGGIVTRGMSVSMASGAVEMCLTAVQREDGSTCWAPLALLKRQEIWYIVCFGSGEGKPGFRLHPVLPHCSPIPLGI